jgi:uncharacterized membrane protein YjgN (DUF898 family)
MSNTASDSAAAPQALRFEYVPRPGLFKITMINLLLNILTLTIYRFWGKTNVRKHIWSCIHVNGEPLEYTGTGMELFKGFLFVFGLFILPYVLINTFLKFNYGEQHPMVLALNGIFFLFIYVMYGFAIYKARKYQLTRTLWRGIRGNLVGSAMTYSLTYFGSILAKTFSLGWATPVMNTVLHEQITNEMRFGDAAFKFKGRAGPLYPTYALCWFLGVVVGIGSYVGIFVYFVMHIAGDGSKFKIEDLAGSWLMIISLILLFFAAYLLIIPALWAIYTAKEMRTFADYTRFDGAQFKLNATAASIIWLTLINLMILVLTLTFGWPFIQQRTFRYVANRLQLEGAIDIDRIQQSQAAIPKRGEGLADAFDISAW